MPEIISANEPAIRLGFFLGILGLVALWEVAAPRRALTQPRWLRWYGNIGIVIFNTAVVRLLVPLAPVALAVFAAERGWGVLNLVDLPFWLEVALSVVVLDFIIYLQHVMFHAVPALWRLHRMHHADLDFDVTTGSRFHPVEIVLSVLLKLAAVVVIGPPAIAVLIFEVLLNGTSMFNHGNVRLPPGLDRVLRRFVVTPDMHRVHHSDIPAETNSNFGFNLPWWDRLFGTYRAQPVLGHEGMTIGLDTFREPGELHFHRMLVQPFRRGRGDYAINRRPPDGDGDL
ncbi:MAG: sterol desaturase family protein [Rhodospirillaceae bacterium]|nr:sterol desaturase family protein [Rhodospirillaceae bacterium]